LVPRPNVVVPAVHYDGHDRRDYRFSDPRPQALVCMAWPLVMTT
jgi:hypothetical protein